MRYDDEGRFLGAEEIVDATTISDHCRWRDDALSCAMPLDDYLRTANRVPDLALGATVGGHRNLSTRGHQRLPGDGQLRHGT